MRKSTEEGVGQRGRDGTLGPVFRLQGLPPPRAGETEQRQGGSLCWVGECGAQGLLAHRLWAPRMGREQA